MWLSDDTFRSVVASTPLASIDLVVTNAEGKILLGQRLNRPAQGYWFVPGGRILKGETLDVAFKRLTQHELAKAFPRDRARLLGIYEHFYADSVFGETGNPNTHYVVLGYQLALGAGEALSPPLEQHGHYGWWAAVEMRNSAEVHDNTRAYLEALNIE